MNLIPIIIIGSIVLFLFSAIFTVKQQTAAVIETFGKFSSIRQSGLQLKIPGIQRIAGRLSL
ncbi:MAG: SPFH domain-containing protein, partial [Polaribacter sp.]|nr:SPFH domain-containing protein [Polaribacter sp.]